MRPPATFPKAPHPVAARRRRCAPLPPMEISCEKRCGARYSDHPYHAKRVVRQALSRRLTKSFSSIKKIENAGVAADRGGGISNFGPPY